MFTGIITDMGRVLETEKRGDLRVRIGTSWDVSTIDIGGSIACDGICLTVVATGDTPQGWFDVDISAETASRTSIGHGGWVPGSRVNLERSLKVGEELGGHIVSGHVDGVAEVLSVTPEGDSVRFRLLAPDEFARFIAPKGSVALNGVSLTVNEVEGIEFGVNIIPRTRMVTTLGTTETGDRVNFEIDTLARYVARLQEWAG